MKRYRPHSFLFGASLVAAACAWTSAGAGPGVVSDDGILQKNSPPTGTLPLPPIGSELGLFYKGERPAGLAPGKEPKPEANPADIRILTMTATKVADPYSPRGRLQVDVLLSKPAKDHYVDLYVSGYYVGVVGEFDGLKDIGRRPAYEFVRLDYANQNKHPSGDPNRRFVFRIPDVLPVQVRAELYQIKQPRAARLLGVKAVGFDTEWKDQGVIAGFLFGSPDKKSISGYAFLVHPGTESVSVRIPAAQPVRPGDFSNDVNVAVRFAKGQTEVKNMEYRREIGWQLNWRASFVSSDPWLMDRDIRNNQYWPNLKGAGYLEIPPIKAGNAPITRYP